MNNKDKVLIDMFLSKRDKSAGYYGICDMLIQKGECISTIHASQLFRQGGVHNFVKQEPFEQGVDLIKLSIDKDSIYDSKLFKEYAYYMVNDKKQRLSDLMKEAEELQSFIDELS